MAALQATTSSFAPPAEQVIGDLDRERLELLLACARRTGSEPCRPGTRSPRSAARRATRAARSARRRRNRIRQPADQGMPVTLLHGARAADGGDPVRPDRRDRASADVQSSRIRSRAMRALIVTNMYPTAEHPALGSFVRDQVASPAAAARHRPRGVLVRARRRGRVRCAPACRARPPLPPHAASTSCTLISG